jgi:pimeloyl-ACP methyl ester carboxylesterase
MKTRRWFCLRAALAAVTVLGIVPGLRSAETTRDGGPLDLEMKDYAYPNAVAYFDLKSQRGSLRMAYMDLAPAGYRGSEQPPPDAPLATVVLFHGKNFFGAYWRDTAEALTVAGFRVIVPDQIGFGKSSKPAGAYSFHAMANHTRELLESLKVPRVAVVGHSMGGMLATRFALMFPDMTSQLVLENPIGLEDYREKIPYVPTEELAQQAISQDDQTIRKYHQSYYSKWLPEFDEYVKVQFRSLHGPDAEHFAYVSALTSQMIYEQPVCYEFSHLRVPALLIIGQDDRTAIGKDRVVKEVAATLGNYPGLGERVAREIPNARLVKLPNVGHIPHLETPKRFHEELIRFLTEPNGSGGVSAR